ncbi:MAG: hypothetical protein KatS3mg083_504 [Candidatus Dojkabacteria bacterium]|nr:MAG: hypothetical protein KatS3mg083_504 [Candidatus Dojkabacteria bacterium]
MKHYQKKNPQPVVVAQLWNLDYLEGNILKYLARYKDKNKQEDLFKMAHYVWFLIQSYSLGEIKDLSNPLKEIFLTKFPQNQNTPETQE